MPERARVLFSCAGTTDPVRGCRDGGLLHIMRHYRPQRIYLFLSAEMTAFETADHRFSKTIEYARTHWDGYDPQLHILNSDIARPDDLDAVYAPMNRCFQQLARENAESMLLINLSSGTPQMKVVLAQLALDVRFNAVGIQVSNPEKRSGSAPRTNDKGFDVEYELELNEDDEPDAPNRCTEPKMLSMQREQRLERIRSLLDRRDYRALEAMQSDLPEALRPLVRHLAARNDLQREAAWAAFRETGLSEDFLYPGQKGADKACKELIEYYLLLCNLCRTQRYSEFVLRVNPFLVQLMLRQLRQALAQLDPPCALEDILESRRDGRICPSPEKLHQRLPNLAQALECRMGKSLDAGRDFSLYLGINMLRLIHGEDAKWTYDLDLLSACEKLNSSQRNSAAHQLHAVTAEQLKAACVDDRGRRYGADDLLKAFGRMLLNAYPTVRDKELFRVYDRCDEYIRQNL